MDLDVDVDEPQDVYVRRFKQDAPFSDFKGISKACYDRVVDKMAAKIGRYRHLLVQQNAIEDEEFDNVSFSKFDKRKFKKHCVAIASEFAKNTIVAEAEAEADGESDFSSSESESEESESESECDDDEEFELPTRSKWVEIVNKQCKDYREGFAEEEEKWDTESFVEELVNSIGTDDDDQYDKLLDLITDKFTSVETDDESIANNLESALINLYASIVTICQ